MTVSLTRSRARTLSRVESSTSSGASETTAARFLKWIVYTSGGSAPMPMSPKRRGFSELMMQYTYLPRLPADEADGADDEAAAAGGRGAVAGRPVATSAGFARLPE